MNEPELFEAADAGDIEAVETLLAAGEQIDGASASGETALMRAASKGQVEIVRLLLKAGADVNAKRADGMTPLIYAAFFDHAEVARVLIDYGADPDARDRLGMRALDWASSKGARNTAAILRRAAAPEGGTSAPRQDTRHGAESEEILNLPEAGAATTQDVLSGDILDLSEVQGPQEQARSANTLQPDVNLLPSEPAEPTRKRASEQGAPEDIDASASDMTAASTGAVSEHLPNRVVSPEESEHPVTPSAASAVPHRPPSADRPGTEPRPSLITEFETEDDVAREAVAGPFLQRPLLSWLPLAGLSFTVMVASAALTWSILHGGENRNVKSALEAAATPARVETPPGPQKSDDDLAVAAALNDWLEATRARDVEKQMSFYAPSLRTYYRKRYVPSSEVRADKAELFGRAHRVDISAGEPEIRYGKKSATAYTRFRKEYRIESDAGGRSGEVIQELIWRKSKDGWKIISERDVTVVR